MKPPLRGFFYCGERMSEPTSFQEHPNVPLLDAKKWLKEQAKTSGGALCPCCNQKQKAQGRKPTPTQIALIAIIYNNYQSGQVVNAEAIALASKIEGLSSAGIERLVHWDLVEPAAEEGHITLCDGGYYFVHKQFPITPRAWILNDQVIARDGKPITMVKILGDKFDVNELFSVRLT